MDSELEVKFYPVEKEKLRALLKKAGAVLAAPERKMRRALFDREIYKQISPKCDVVRVRDEGGGVITFTAKLCAHDGAKIEDQKEVEVTVSDFEKTLEILALLGFTPNRYVETLRETWEHREAAITIDTWPGLEPYIEIEAKSEETVKAVAEELGFDWDKRLIMPAASLFAKIYNLEVGEVIKKMNNSTFENNPFAGLPQKRL